LNLRGRPELAERLAAEYALGTLRGRARTRFRRALEADGALARAVAEWEARLAPLAQGVRAVEPPARVWRAIESRLGPASPRKESGLWKALGLVAGGAAAAMLGMAVFVSPPRQAPAPPPAAVAPSYIAVLSDPKTSRPVMMASAGRKDGALQVKLLDPRIQVADASLELWALPAGGKPKSLGLIGGEKTTLKLAGIADQALGDVPMLAVSLEPRGGSKTGAPTGPVLYSGPCVKSW
jgi:anti-sigma-K factor RskA